ncbi:MAG: four helix bundle protein [Gemmatimonadaceae bacterium]
MHHYEQLDVWTRGVSLAARLHRCARESTRGTDRSLWQQISRAAVSIPANVAEGAQRGSDREFARFLGIAMGSAAELHTLIGLARAATMLPDTDARTFAQEALALRRMASALRSRALGMRHRGNTTAT